MRKDYDIVGSYDNQRVSTINAERTVNLFEYLDANGKRPKVLLPTAGLINQDLNFGAETGGSRATFVFQDAIYQVFGASVYRITGTTNALLVSKIGSLTTTTGYVGVDANTFQVIFVDGALGYIWDTKAQTFEEITDTGFPASPIDVCFIDGFFIVANGGTNNFQMSSINQGMVWSGGTSNFTADATTDILTLSTNSANFATGVPVTLTTTAGGATFTADAGTDILTLSTSNANFTTGTSLKFSTTGTLPNPLNTTDTYFSIMVGTPSTNPGTIKVATTFANALAGTAIDLTTNGTPTNTVNANSILPSPLVSGTTYYAIRVSASSANPATIKLATTYDNAIAGIAIDLTNNGAPVNTITTTGQLQLGSITSHPGNIVGCRTLHRRIFLFSENFTEVWENAGLGTNLPIRRNNSLLMEVGTPALGSISVGFDRMFFLSQDRDGLAGVTGVYGTESNLVSNRALDFQLAQYAADPLAGVADARGVLIKENGLIFYRLNFTAANHTFVYDLSMSTQESPKWHEEEILNGNRHPAQTHAYFDGVNYYGDYKSPKFYMVSDQTSTNDGETIRRMRIGRQMTPEGYNRLRIDRFQLDLLQGQLDIETFVDIDLDTEFGEPITTESDINIILDQQIPIGGGQPIVFLSVSKDGGQSYGPILQATMGKLGERTFRTVWRKLGTTPRGQGFVPKIEFFNEVPFVVLGAAWDFETLPE
jgi:hypothetical protein